MALINTARTAQDVLVAEFRFKHDDTMVPKAGGTAVDFGFTNTSATTVVSIPLPPNSTVLRGTLDRTEAFDATTFNVTVGLDSDADEFLTTTDIKLVGSTDLIGVPYWNESGENVELTFTASDACTTGEAVLRIEYAVADRATEVQVA
jgi:hypothetical protein